MTYKLEYVWILSYFLLNLRNKRWRMYVITAVCSWHRPVFNLQHITYLDWTKSKQVKQLSNFTYFYLCPRPQTGENRTPVSEWRRNDSYCRVVLFRFDSSVNRSKQSTDSQNRCELTADRLIYVDYQAKNGFFLKRYRPLPRRLPLSPEMEMKEVCSCNAIYNMSTKDEYR